MRFLVFQHIDCEHPGIFRSFMRREGVEWDAVELDEGEKSPALDGYDALIVMGGPMDVWDIEDNPWLVEEKRQIRRWVSEIRRPFLGLCLGHQLLADAMGGTCGLQRPPEIGICKIELTDEAADDPVFGGLDRHQHCLQWHSVRVAQLPEDTVVLARSDVCPVQAMRVGDRAWAMQYHMELEDDTIANWGDIPAYKAALESTLGPGALHEMQETATRHMKSFAENADALFGNFLKQARG